MTDQTNAHTPDNHPTVGANAGENISGRGVFVIETVPVGVAVRTAFLAEDGRLLNIPAVFPDLMYAMAQIDDLRQHVARRFAEAAQVGSQVIAQQIEMNRAQAQTSTTSGASSQEDLKQVETKDAAGSAGKSAKESSKESKAVPA